MISVIKINKWAGFALAVIGLSARGLTGESVFHLPGLPVEWQFGLYDLSSFGLPIRVIGQRLPLASTTRPRATRRRERFLNVTA